MNEKHAWWEWAIAFVVCAPLYLAICWRETLDELRGKGEVRS